MNKRTPIRLVTVMLVCLLICGLTALAAEADPTTILYPAEVQSIIEDESRQIIKTYLLAAEESPGDIPRGDFTRDGWHYTLAEITQNRCTNTITKDHTEAVTVTTDSQKLADILALLPPAMEYTSEDGYAGVLTLDAATVQSEAAGYKNTSRTVSATREYPHLSANDLSLIPKTITENGRTLELDGVTWEVEQSGNVDGIDIPESYRAVASYTGTAYQSYVTGYNTTANYVGVIETTVEGDTVYTVSFLGSEIVPEPAPTHDKEQNKLLLIVGLVFLAVVTVGGGAYLLTRRSRGAKSVAAFALLCVLGMTMTAPAFAYDYTFSATGTALGVPTSIDTPVPPDPMSENERRNKDAAYTPPPYGFFGGDIPTDLASLHHGNPSAGGGAAPDASYSIPVISAPSYFADGSIGTLSIPSLGITVKAFEGETTESMNKGVGHFVGTSAWDGNIALCGHNRGGNYNIGTIKNLMVGDTIRYTTPQGSRTYTVTFVGTISSTDWTHLGATADNRITLITCLADQPSLRVCVQAVAP